MSRHRKSRIELMRACNEIRRYRVEQGYSNQQIMNAMHLPESMFYYYQQKIIEQDMRDVERTRSDLLAHQIILLRDRFEDSYRNLSQIAKDKENAAKDRIDAEGKRMEASVNIFKLQKEGPNAIGLTTGYHREPENTIINKPEPASQ